MSNSLPDDISVSLSADRRNGKTTVKTQLQGMLLGALEEMAHDRRIEMDVLIKEIIEQRLVKDQYLPEWWFSRKGIR